MKEISKVKAYVKKSLASIISEKKILSNLHHPFLSNLHFSFQDKEYLYLILDFLPGGDLRFYLHKRISFSENQIKFFISNLIISLNYIHSMNIIHRDIKPENLVFDGRGYLHLTDFGISKKIKSGKPIINNSGTPGYFAPEVLMKKPQNFCSDFFSVGVICFELLYGKKPFKGNNRKEVSEKLLYKNIKLKSMDVPYGFSEYIADFINRLLKRNQKERLGYKGIDEIKNHRWLKDVNWELMENKNIESEKIPFSPFIGDNFDMDYVNKKDNIYSEHYDEYLKKINEAEILKDFYFNYHNNLLPNKKRNSISKEKQSNSNKKYTNTTSGNKTTRAMSDGLNASNDTCFENNENNNNGIEIMKNSNFNNDVNINELNLKKSISC